MDEPTRHTRWDQDGINGGPSSIAIIVEWLTTGNNYLRWRGREAPNPNGQAQMCPEILELMHDHDIPVKIDALVRQYCSAQAHVSLTQIDNRLEPQEIQAYMLRLCPYWVMLDPIIGPLESNQTQFVMGEESDSESTNST
ncbi:hypothetical protein PTTG_28863 [Puccinia triticina 1-1 BBBD Race 1]|uniref:Uncharacterized protein n=2 Tax=Puccinia triticina TaxID=208348 RepID=A0A180GAI3_PUCT1|nr:uncharacterized protein PtA15_15A144 [Puccinia triticina]OAV88933.1 hypothetical protein PTTG_28863 [Puccinia triticina 1-1 BBBD Race 1]WAQ91752.1 hypothetical protein PtA15_15A144 [Puccinia triticina]WAR62546.1 hypothetical protein PtB15_15B132 [Puccinia triticina]